MRATAGLRGARASARPWMRAAAVGMAEHCDDGTRMIGCPRKLHPGIYNPDGLEIRPPAQIGSAKVKDRTRPCQSANFCLLSRTPTQSAAFHDHPIAAEVLSIQQHVNNGRQQTTCLTFHTHKCQES